MSSLFVKIARNLGLLQSREKKLMKLRLSTVGRTRVPNNVIINTLGSTKIHGGFYPNNTKRRAGLMG